MASETIILRPVRCISGNASPSASDIAYFNWYQLVDESVCDGDSTYLNFGATTNPLNNDATFRYNNNKPSNIEYKVASVRLHIFYRNQSTSGEGSVLMTTQMLFIDSSEELLTSFNVSTDFYNQVMTDYEEMIVDLQDAVNILNNYEVAFFNIRTQFTQTGEKNFHTYISTFYVEVVYQNDEGEQIYFKQNGLWSTISGTIYKKENGVWVASDTSAFIDGNKIVVEDLTS